MADAVSRAARRRFLKLATAGVAAAPFGGMLAMRRAHAQEKVSENDELAKQLGYKQDASQVDASQWPDYAQSHVCANCQLFHGEQGQDYRPCDLFGGNLVDAKGWCQGWTEREA
jgi:High potential iron-sulfur protein